MKLSIIFLLFAMVHWTLTTAHITQAKPAPINIHEAHQNAWYHMVNLTANRLGFNNSCYICSWIPHHSLENPTMTAIPVSLNDTICLLHAHTRQAFESRKCTIPHCCSPQHQQRRWSRPASYSASTNSSISKGIHLLRLTGKDPFCISVSCSNSMTLLGRSTCDDTLPGDGWTVRSRTSHTKKHWLTLRITTPGYITINVTLLSLVMTGRPYYPPWKTHEHNLEVPSIMGMGTPEGYIWKCGSSLYLYLPRDWCGTCSLARLQPSSYIITEEGSVFTRTPESKRHKREFKPIKVFRPFSSDDSHKPLYDDSKGMLYTIFPQLGTASLMKRMNEVWWTLENITTILSDMTLFLANNPERQAMKTMLLQHQLALDILFASEGGLCAKIGEHCCTYLPSSRDNWTLIHDRVRQIGDFLKSNESTGGSWSFMSWLMSGNWYQLLLKFLTPVIIILVMICLVLGCVIPCLKNMVSKLMTNALVQYTLLRQKEELAEDEYIA
uniref:Envelope polyprotein n=1 Tax=Nothobranchius pienaari TaxID=704102 RepID=A0A1A8L831_9TELE